MTATTTLAADRPTAGVLLLLLGLCVVFLGLGVAHYRGWNKAGLLRTPFDSLHFMPAWFGGAFLLALLAELALPVSAVLALVLFVAVVPVFLIGLVGLFWLPDRLLPGWYLAWRDSGRPALEVANRFDRKDLRRRAEREQRRNP